jgi:hypothetical protein
MKHDRFCQGAAEDILPESIKMGMILMSEEIHSILFSRNYLNIIRMKLLVTRMIRDQLINKDTVALQD